MKSIIALLLSFLPFLAWAQQPHRTPTDAPIAPPTQRISDTSRIDIITTLGNNEYLGQILSMTQDVVILQTLTNEVYHFERKNVLKIDNILYGDYLKKFIRVHKSAPSLYLQNTAFSLPKGKKSYETVGFLVTHIIDYGLTDKITIGGGLTSILPTLRVKATFPITKNFRMGLGSSFSIVTIPNFNSRTTTGSDQATTYWGATYGLATIGTPNSFLTMSGGFAYFGNGEGSNALRASTGIIQLGGFHRIGNSAGIFGEFAGLTPSNSSQNITPSVGLYMGAVGIRLLYPNSSWDLGILVMGLPVRSPVPPYATNLAPIPMPMVGYKYHFNN